MRGTPLRLTRRRCFSGIIPAYAGNTRCTRAGRASTRDHPRVCGEHIMVLQIYRALGGSSPRMRGTPRTCSRNFHGIGIIPAYAGNTPWVWPCRCGGRDHPRVCGEHPCAVYPSGGCWGSSPRMRGTQPARPQAIANSQDHPRVCGEHIVTPQQQTLFEGSSPRMRGTQLSVLQTVYWSGIIPAYAGNTSMMGKLFSFFRDHPRVCGEHRASHGKPTVESGSSPRMRGTLSARYARIRTRGIIPAYAGNTARIRRTPTITWDHPRVCGEHTKRLA